MGKRLYKATDEVVPVREYTADEIKKIRKKTGTTQGFLANWLGVSKKTVQAWESGRNIPNGASARLLTLLDNNVVDIDIFLSEQNSINQ
jgi:putative transcriptional regulator